MLSVWAPKVRSTRHTCTERSSHCTGRMRDGTRRRRASALPARGGLPPAWAAALLAQAEPADDRKITVPVPFAEVAQQAGPLADHLEEAAPAGMVLLVRAASARCSSLMRAVSRAICTSGEPVSSASRRYWSMISVLRSFVIAISVLIPFARTSPALPFVPFYTFKLHEILAASPRNARVKNFAVAAASSRRPGGVVSMPHGRRLEAAATVGNEWLLTWRPA